MGFVGRLAQDHPVALDHGVAADDHGRGTPPGHVGRLLIGQPGHELRRILAAAQPALRRIVGRHNLELVAGLGQELAPPRRAAGQDQLGSNEAMPGKQSGQWPVVGGQCMTASKVVTGQWSMV